MKTIAVNQQFFDLEVLADELQELQDVLYTLFVTRSSKKIDGRTDVNPKLVYLYLDLRCKFSEKRHETQGSKNTR